MAIDNSLYDSLQNTYNKVKEYLETTTLSKEHSMMIIKHEELAELLENLDIEAIEEQSKDIHALHDELNAIKDISNSVIEDLANIDDTLALTTKVAQSLNTVFARVSKVIV